MNSLNSLSEPAEKVVILAESLTRSPSFLEKTRKFVSQERKKIVQPVVIKETLSTVSTKLRNTWSHMTSKAKKIYSYDFNNEKTSSSQRFHLSSSSNEKSDLLNNSSNRSPEDKDASSNEENDASSHEDNDASSHEDNEDNDSETSESSVNSITSSLIEFQNDFAERKNELLEIVGLGFDDNFDKSSIPLIKKDCNFDFQLRYKQNVGNSSTIKLDSLKEVIYDYC